MNAAQCLAMHPAVKMHYVTSINQLYKTPVHSVNSIIIPQREYMTVHMYLSPWWALMHCSLSVRLSVTKIQTNVHVRI